MSNQLDPLHDPLHDPLELFSKITRCSGSQERLTLLHEFAGSQHGTNDPIASIAVDAASSSLDLLIEQLAPDTSQSFSDTVTSWHPKQLQASLFFLQLVILYGILPALPASLQDATRKRARLAARFPLEIPSSSEQKIDEVSKDIQDKLLEASLRCIYRLYERAFGDNSDGQQMLRSLLGSCETEFFTAAVVSSCTKNGHLHAHSLSDSRLETQSGSLVTQLSNLLSSNFFIRCLVKLLQVTDLPQRERQFITQQLAMISLRPNGVAEILEFFFAATSITDLKTLEMASRLIATVPQNADKTVYMDGVCRQLLILIVQEKDVNAKEAFLFVLSEIWNTHRTLVNEMALKQIVQALTTNWRLIGFKGPLSADDLLEKLQLIDILLISNNTEFLLQIAAPIIESIWAIILLSHSAGNAERFLKPSIAIIQRYLSKGGETAISHWLNRLAVISGNDWVLSINEEGDITFHSECLLEHTVNRLDLDDQFGNQSDRLPLTTVPDQEYWNNHVFPIDSISVSIDVARILIDGLDVDVRTNILAACIERWLAPSSNSVSGPQIILKEYKNHGLRSAVELINAQMNGLILMNLAAALQMQYPLDLLKFPKRMIRIIYNVLNAESQALANTGLLRPPGTANFDQLAAIQRSVQEQIFSQDDSSSLLSSEFQQNLQIVTDTESSDGLVEQALDLISVLISGADDLRDFKLLKDPLKLLRDKASGSIRELSQGILDKLNEQSSESESVLSASEAASHDEPSPIASATQLILSDSIPDRALGMQILADQLSLHASINMDRILELIVAVLREEEDSFVFLPAIRALSLLLCNHPLADAQSSIDSDQVIRIIQHYSDTDEPIEFRVRLGQALVEMIELRGQSLRKETGQPLILALVDILSRKSDDVRVRASAASILESIISVQPFLLTSNGEEVVGCVEHILQFERGFSTSDITKSEQIVRRACIFLLQAVIAAALNKDLFPKRRIARTAQLLDYIETSDSDWITREQVSTLKQAVKDRIGEEIATVAHSGPSELLEIGNEQSHKTDLVNRMLSLR